jgi:hypothetical protein
MTLSKYLPFTREGRQTLIYLMFAGAGPALCLIVMWAMSGALAHVGLWSLFAQLSLIVAICLLVTVSGFAAFVAIRALKIGRDGFSMEGAPQGDPPSQ